MYSIGTMSKRTGVKVPTIRYYEDIGMLPRPERNAGNQRRYDDDGLRRLSFISHARQLGFSLDAIRALIHLQDQPDHRCAEAGDIATAQLSNVRARIARLRKLETELARIADGCAGDGATAQCYVLASLADHALCETDHRPIAAG